MEFLPGPISQIPSEALQLRPLLAHALGRICHNIKKLVHILREAKKTELAVWKKRARDGDLGNTK